MKQIIKKTVLIKLIFLFFISVAFFMSSRVCQKTFYSFDYNVGCYHCGDTENGMLSIELAADSSRREMIEVNELSLVITNKTNDIILINPDYFSLTVNNHVIMNPVNNDCDDCNSYNRDGYKVIFPEDRIRSIPKGSTIEVPLHNYFDHMFYDKMVSNGLKRNPYLRCFKKPDVENFKKEIEKMQNFDVKIFVAYKLQNDVNWRQDFIKVVVPENNIEKHVLYQ